MMSGTSRPVDMADKPLVNPVVITVNGREVTLHGDKEHIFVDALNFVDFNITALRGNFILKLNGHNAGFTDPLKNGDVIEVIWEE